MPADSGKSKPLKPPNNRDGDLCQRADERDPEGWAFEYLS